MNYLISPEAGCGHACELSVALKKLIPLESYYMTKSGYELDFIDTENVHFGYNFPKRGKHLFIMTVYEYEQIIKFRGENYFDNFDRVTIIIPDGMMCNDPDGYNKKFKDFEVFATLCKMQYCNGAKEYIQPFNLNFTIKKNKQLTVCHSVFNRSKMNEKGSRQIIKVFKELNCNYRIITGLNWKDALKLKAQCHILVDQLPDKNYHFNFTKNWNGGIGKSGLESMLLKTMVISYGKEFKSKEIPTPPVAWVTDNLKEVLKFYIENEKERIELTERQYEWALKYTNPEFQAKRLL